MSPKQLENLLKQLLQQPRETEWLEFKKNNDHELGEYISALSNSALLTGREYGYIIFGISDTKEVVGTTFRPKAERIGNEELENWLARLLRPRIDFYFYELDYQGKHITLVKIEATKNQPVAFSNIEYIRIGSYKKKLCDFPEKERKIWNHGPKTIFEEGIAKDNLDDEQVLDLLDYTKFFELTESKLPSNKEAILEKLKEEKFINKTDSHYQIKNLGAILFAKNLNLFDKLERKAIRVILYDGKNRIRTIKEHLISKGYATGFTLAVDYINDQLPTREKIGDVYRVEEVAFPKIAVRELVANAIIHQDFSKSGTGPMVEIFVDRIEITNPGKPLISPQRFMDHNPQSRNEKLASFMRRINICEERGSGIDKVIYAVEKNQLPAPDFIEEEQFLRVFLYSHKLLKSMSTNDRVRACYQHCCLKQISKEVMTNESLRERFDIAKQNYPMASRIIADTIQSGLIKPQEIEGVGKSKKLAKYIPFWA